MVPGPLGTLEADVTAGSMSAVPGGREPDPTVNPGPTTVRRMYRVLVPVDTSEERAIRQAEFVTSLPKASEEVEVTLLFVFTEDIGSSEAPDQVERFRSAERVGSVRRAEEVLEGVGVTYNLLEESGEAAEDITDEAEELDADLVVLGGRKRSPVGKVLFGSVSQEVLLNTDYPVVVTGG